MDSIDEVNLNSLQKEERYKKLQQNLKLSRMKQVKLIQEADLNLRNKVKTNFNLKGNESPWPSCSSINADPSDFNCTLSSLQTSKTGSEVLTSCLHLRNLVSKRPIPHKPMATSSVKQFSESDERTDDRAIMPPPSSNIIRPPSKRSATGNPIPPPIQSRQPSLFNDDLSSRGKQSNLDLNCSSDNLEHAGSSFDPDRGQVRDFYRWKVFLNDQGQLLIKGTLDNGKIARSKPVLKMLSSNRVESIFRHIYCLHGNIVDDKNELPKYIYSKFYNGFPDDWENVFQIWKNFVAQGSKESFRWPLDVSLSDDDLNSEITDITYMQKTIRKQFHVSSSIEKSTPHRSSGYSSDIHQERNTKSNDSLSKDANWKDQSHFSHKNDSTQILNQTKEKENKGILENRNHVENSNDRSRGNLYAALDYAQTLKDIIFEDKLTIITQTLLHENCPKEYVKNVNKTIECLDYLLSYKIGELDDSAAKRPRIELKNDTRIEDIQRNSNSFSKPDESILNVSKPIPIKEVVEKRSNLEPEIQREMNEMNPKVINQQMVHPKINTDISESETYTGVPKIPADRIFQSKSYYQRYKGKKFDRNSKINKMHLNTEDQQNNFAYDSSVSLTEEEIQKKYEDKESKTRLNLDNVQFKLNNSEVRTNCFNEDTNPDSLKQNREIGNRAPLEVLRKAYFEENRTISKKLSGLANNEKRKILTDKENMETNKQSDFSGPLQRKDTQNLKHLDSNNDRGNQIATIISSEITDLVHMPKRPQKNQFMPSESNVNRQESIESNNVAFLKSTEKFQNSEKNAHGNIQEDSMNDSFGSEKNPKPLESWIPLVSFDGKEYHLLFEGTLLNAVGRPMKKKFTTDRVVRRISSTIIETEDHQFYKLVGHLNNNKHVVPKELLSQCRNGCPAKIDHFCSTWLNLKRENNVVVERLQKATLEHPQNIPSSSHGRRILPPLSYWADERVIRKDDKVIYKPGDQKDEFVSSGINSPKKHRNAQGQEHQFDLTTKMEKKGGSKIDVLKSNTDPFNEEYVSSNEAIQGSPNSETAKYPIKTRLCHKLSFSSSDSDEVTEKINTRAKRKNRKGLEYNETPSRNDKKIIRQGQIQKNVNPYALRKRQKLQVDTDIESDADPIVDKAEGKKLPAQDNNKALQRIRCTYRKQVQDKDATLSDDMASIV